MQMDRIFQSWFKDAYIVKLKSILQWKCFNSIL